MPLLLDGGAEFEPGIRLGNEAQDLIDHFACVWDHVRKCTRLVSWNSMEPVEWIPARIENRLADGPPMTMGVSRRPGVIAIIVVLNACVYAQPPQITPLPMTEVNREKLLPERPRSRVALTFRER